MTRSGGDKPSTPRGLRIVADAVAIASAIALATYLRFSLGFFEVTESTELTAPSHVRLGLFWIVGLMIAFGLERLYDEDTLVVGGDEGARVLYATVRMGALSIILIYFTRTLFVSRAWFGLVLLLSVLFAWSARLVVGGYVSGRRKEGAWKRPLLFVTKDPQGIATLEGAEEFELVGSVEPGRFLEEIKDRRARGERPHVLVEERGMDRDDAWRIVLEAGRLGLTTFVISPVRSIRRDRLTVRPLAGNTLVRVTPAGLRGVKAFQKRAFDVLVATVALILLSPALAVVALLVVLRDGRPVLYRQTRAGLEGSEFTITKFRTMARDAEAKGPGWTKEEDPRVTPLGRRLRRWGLDELPQLVSVIKGHMSLVGPRPEQVAHIERLSRDVDWYSFRHRTRPGIAGWAQAHGLRGDTPLGARIEHDNWYIENWSLWLDMRILIRSIVELIRGQRTGANRKGSSSPRS